MVDRISQSFFVQRRLDRSRCHVNMSANNFVRSGPNFTNCFCSTTKRSFSSTSFRFCRYLHRFQRYLRSNSKVVVNCTDFCTLFCPLKF